MMNKAYRYRLYPTNEQKIMFAKTFGCARFIYTLIKPTPTFGTIENILANQNSNLKRLIEPHTQQTIRNHR